MCSKNIVKTIKMFAVSINLLSVTPQELLKAYSKGGGKTVFGGLMGYKHHTSAPLCVK